MARFPRRRQMRRKPKMLRRRLKFKRAAVRQPVQFFKRTVYLKAAYASSTTADTPFAKRFAISDLPNITDFTNLYDQYCVKGIKFSMIPRTSEADTSQALPNIGTVLDFDDNNVPTGWDQITQYESFKMTRGNKVHNRYFKPAVSPVVWSGTALANAYMVKKNQWIDVTYVDTPHYGIKGVIGQTLVAQTYDVKIDMYLAFKNVR